MSACFNRLLTNFCFPLFFVILIGAMIPADSFGLNIKGELSREGDNLSLFTNPTGCEVSIDYIEVADCVGEDGDVDLSVGGTTNREIVVLEVFIDEAFFFFDVFVNDGVWFSNLQIEGSTIDYVRAIAGNSETGCSSEHNIPIEMPVESCGGDTLRFTVDPSLTCPPTLAEITMYDVGTTIVKQVFIADYNEELAAYEIINPLLGAFDTYVKPWGCLQQVYSDMQIQAGSQDILLQSLKRGDLDHSNSVNIVDASMLSESFNSSEGAEHYSSISDFNCDGIVNVIDVSFLNVSFGLDGETPQDQLEE